MAVTISHSGYVKRVPLETYQAQARGGKGIKASDSKDDDFDYEFFLTRREELLDTYDLQGPSL